MAKEKNFSNDPTKFFLSGQSEPAADPEQEPEKKSRYSHRRNAANDFTPPPGYTLRPEPKTERISVLCTKRIYDAITYSAKVHDESRNELINNILLNYLMDEGLLKDDWKKE